MTFTERSDGRMTVKEVLSLLSYDKRFELVGARTGKRLCCS